MTAELGLALESSVSIGMDVFVVNRPLLTGILKVRLCMADWCKLWVKILDVGLVSEYLHRLMAKMA